MEVIHHGVDGGLVPSHAVEECRLALVHVVIPNQQTREKIARDHLEEHEAVTALVVQVNSNDQKLAEKLYNYQIYLASTEYLSYSKLSPLIILIERWYFFQLLRALPEEPFQP